MTVEKVTQYEGTVDWRFPSEKPSGGSRVILETITGETIVETLKEDFDEWASDVARWAYLDKMEDHS